MLEHTKTDMIQTFNMNNASIAMCLGRTMAHMEYPDEAAMFVMQAASLGLPEARLCQWVNKHSQALVDGFTDSAQETQAIRWLRSLVWESADVWPRLFLCKCYMKGMLGGVDKSSAVIFTRQLFQSSRPVNVTHVLSLPHLLNSSMRRLCVRHVLVDWLAEVASNLGLTTLQLLNTVAIVDRCLLARSFCRAEIQLLGISAILITSRYMADEILTIREAAWYTDNTYTYENVVEMAGDIISILKGNIRQVTSHDMRNVLEPLCELDEYGLYLLDYIEEMCQLHSHMTTYSPAMVAAGSIVVARILLNFSNAWPSKLVEVTGFSLVNLTSCVLDINKCLLEDVQYDAQDSPMQAVSSRFTGEYSLYDLSEIKPLSDQELRDKLGVVSHQECRARSRMRLRQAQELICSPSRGKQGSWRMSMVDRPSREDASTPPLDLDTSSYDDENDEDSDPFDLNESFCSNRSEDVESELRTDSFCELSSEPDGASGDLPSSNPPSFISGCSQAALSSPYITINISNFHLSTSSSSSSGIGSSNSSFSSQPVGPAGSGHCEQIANNFEEENSLGFCTEISQDEEDGKGMKLADNSTLPFPIMESCVLDELNHRRALYDPEPMDVVEDYGVLNEAFCEQDLEEPSTSAQSQFSLSHYLNTSQSTSVKTIAQAASPCVEGLKYNVDSADEVMPYPITVQGGSPGFGNNTLGSEAKVMNRSPSVFLPFVKDCEFSSATSGAVQSPAGAAMHCHVSLGYPVPESGHSAQEHSFVLEGDSAAIRRKSLRSSTKTSQQLHEHSTAGSHCKDFCHEHMDVCASSTNPFDSAAHRLLSGWYAFRETDPPHLLCLMFQRLLIAIEAAKDNHH
ncbi:uncharacterized protein LOC143292020 [Babylonia areolata]|uniref:uncharacterized protein LOC143292020 n=1 Tax=Babylonia areolata TaxID=304850 RepID=UPI003FD41D97